MDKILALIPKNVLAFLAIVGGIAFIVLSQPPHRICDSQTDLINDLQRRFLFKDPKSKQLTVTKYQRLRDHCKATNDPGGCYELFQEIKILLHDLSTLTDECSAEVGSVKEYKNAIRETIELMVRLAWGEAPPASYSSKLRWLDVADVSLFCKLKQRFIAVYGQSDYEQFQERMLREMPGAEALARNQVWDLSLISENCSRYP